MRSLKGSIHGAPGFVSPVFYLGEWGASHRREPPRPSPYAGVLPTCYERCPLSLDS